MRLLLGIYDPVLNWALKHRKTVIAGATLLLASALILAFGLPRPMLSAVAQVVTPAGSTRHSPGLPSSSRAGGILPPERSEKRFTGKMPVSTLGAMSHLLDVHGRNAQHLSAGGSLRTSPFYRSDRNHAHLG